MRPHRQSASLPRTPAHPGNPLSSQDPECLSVALASVACGVHSIVVVSWRLAQANDKRVPVGLLALA